MRKFKVVLTLNTRVLQLERNSTTSAACVMEVATEYWNEGIRKVDVSPMSAD